MAELTEKQEELIKYLSGMVGPSRASMEVKENDRHMHHLSGCANARTVYEKTIAHHSMGGKRCRF